MNFDIKTINKWAPPRDDESKVKILAMPNVPKPLHTCLRGDAEVLTSAGWKKIKEVSTSDTVATWDMDSEKIKWDNPYETIKTYAKQMVRIKYKKYKTFGMLVTPEHRLPIRKKSDGRVQVDGVRVKGEKKWELRDTTAAKINLNQFQHFITAARNGTDLDNELTDLEKIYISIQADGSLRRDTMTSKHHNHRYSDNFGLRCYCVSLKKERKKERFEYLCNNSKVKWTKQNHNKNSSYVQNSYQKYNVWVEPDCKNFWNCFDITIFGKKKAIQFLDEISVWDGSCAETCGILNRRYVTTNKDNAMFAQAVAVIAGLTSSFQVKKAVPEENIKERYIIDFLDRDFRASQSCVKEVEDFDDYVYCINVPTSYFVVRDADTQSVMITGNCAPRTILGDSTWNRMRKRCYYNAGYKCEVCGCEPERGKLHSHELYEVDYDRCTSTFVRCVALCTKCHTEPGVHTGRAYTMYHNGNVLMPKQKLLEGVEHIFKLVHDYNQNKPKDEEDLRLFATYVQFWKDKTLKEEMERLINQYDIKFYNVPPTEMSRWGEWKLIIGDKEYPTKFATVADWENAMAQNVKPGRIKSEEEKEVDALWEVL